MGSVGSKPQTSLVDTYPYNSKVMKVGKKRYAFLINEWANSILESTSEEDIAYNNEFFLRQLYKKKYLPFV